MRFVILGTIAWLSGCIADQWHDIHIDHSSCLPEQQFRYYPDRDGDGWGSPEASVWACTSSEASHSLADLLGIEEVAASPNGRDCNDDPWDPRASSITGQTATLCPDDFVTGLPDQRIFYTPVIAVGMELVALHDEPVTTDARATPVTWPTAAADTCGPWGWGGGIFGPLEGSPAGSLVSFSSQPNALLDALSESIPAAVSFAGWVGAVSHREAKTPGLDEGWYWEDVRGGAVAYTPVADTLDALPYCNAEPDTTRHDRLALVVDDRPCLGLPSDAGARYSNDFEAHFLCAREIPDPTNFIGPG
ncbi:MAG: hypothetical protein KC912_23815 [Proteobacteria bacterium]|nr:hypothetical protein [Pseudomonadota bacterium]